MIGAMIPTSQGPCDVSNALCAIRPCLHVGEDKGTFSPGRGYTSYHAKPRIVCLVRHCHGCPSPQPEPDAKSIPCCDRMAFAPIRLSPLERKNGGKPNPWRGQICKGCGERSSGEVLRVRREFAEFLPARYISDREARP